MKKYSTCLILVLLFLGGLARAQTTNWTGDIDNHWDKAGNWTNGVPDVSKTAEIAYFPPSKPDPVIYQSTNFKGLEMTNFGSAYSVVIKDGVTITMDDLSTPSGGNPSDYLLDIGNADVIVNDVFQNDGKLSIDNGSLIAKGGLTSNAIIEIQTGSVQVGTPAGFANLNALSNSNITLNQGSFTVYGETTLDSSSKFKAGSGQIEFHDKLTFGGATSFTPGTSSVTLDGTFDLTSANAGLLMNFNELKITSGSQITSKTELIINQNLDCEGTLDVESYGGGSNGKHGPLDVIGKVTGAENITSLFPYIIKLEVTGTNTLKAYFDQDMYQPKAETASYYEIRSSTDNGSSVVSAVSSAVLTNGKIVTLTTTDPIVESQDFVLFVKGDSQYSTGTWIDGVINTALYSVNDLHKKRFTKNFVVWTGNTDTEQDIATNWKTGTGLAPNLTTNLELRYDPSAQNDLKLKQDNAVVNNISNPSTKNLDLNGHNIRVNGTITMSGGAKIIADADGSTLEMGGNKPQTLKNGLFSDNTINNLSIDNPQGVQIAQNFTDNLKLRGVLRLKAGQFNTNGKLLFKSTASKTAILAPVGVNGNTGSIIGDVTVERYYPPRRAFRFVASPVTTTTSVNANWQEGVHNTQTTGSNFNINPKPGYGTHITGSKTGQKGFDATPSGNPSLFLFNNSSQNYNAITSTDNTTLQVGEAYRLMIRGDRGINVTSNASPPTPTVLQATGKLKTGNFQTQNLSAESYAYNMVANPYQAVVDMKKVLQNSQGMRPNFYIWDPIQNTRGAYVAIDSDDGSHPGNSEANNLLQPGVSFFAQVKSDASSISLPFQESFKTLDTIPLAVFSTETSSTIYVDLYTDEALSENGNTADGFLVKFSEDYANAVNDNDAQKFGNLDENLAILNDGNYLSIEKRKFPSVGDVTQFYNDQYRSGNYTYKIKVNNLENVTAYLHDAYLGTSTALANNETTSVGFSVNPDVAESVAWDRFKIVYEESALNTKTQSTETVNLYPNPTRNGLVHLEVPSHNTGKMDISVYSLLGQQVYHHTFETTDQPTISLQLSNLNAGIYMVKGKLANGQGFSKKLVIE